VNSISPGYTGTKLVENLVSTPEGKSMLDRWNHMTPMGRMAEVSNFHGAVVYLASPASDYVTGDGLVIDGGYSTW
jgi:NAD(P)-dependent dehydrogenase (short-subunit alcohol dehydrogenase family)